MLITLTLQCQAVENPFMHPSRRANDLLDIRRALESVAKMISAVDRSAVSVSYSCNGDPVTSLDRAINRLLHESLPQNGEGWLSEESDESRYVGASSWGACKRSGGRLDHSR